MERTDSKHGHRKDQKHAARLPDGNTATALPSQKGSKGKKAIDGYEQQQICRTHPPPKLSVMSLLVLFFLIREI